jgi:hypothetical protein
MTPSLADPRAICSPTTANSLTSTHAVSMVLSTLEAPLVSVPVNALTSIFTRPIFGITFRESSSSLAHRIKANEFADFYCRSYAETAICNAERQNHQT